MSTKETLAFVRFDEDYLVAHDVSTDENRRLFVSGVTRAFLKARAGRPPEPIDFAEADVDAMPESIREDAMARLNRHRRDAERWEEARPVVERGQALIDAGDVDGMLAFLEEEDDLILDLSPGGRGDNSVVRVRPARPDQEIWLQRWV